MEYSTGKKEFLKDIVCEYLHQLLRSYLIYLELKSLNDVNMKMNNGLGYET